MFFVLQKIKTPTHYITAHVSKINQLDWSPTDEHRLASGSQDATVKVWVTADLPQTPDLEISLKFPVWKISYAVSCLSSVLVKNVLCSGS